MIGFQLPSSISNVFKFVLQQFIFLRNFLIEILHIVFTAGKFRRVLILN